MGNLFFKEYPDYISVLQADFARAAISFPGTNITNLAQSLITEALLLDRRKALDLPVDPKCKKVVRDAFNPTSCTTEEVALASWADALSFPLKKGEEWNKGRRATATGTKYQIIYRGPANGVSQDDFEELPDHRKDAEVINPYMNTGLNGRGVLGQNGPNHAADNGLFVIKPDETGEDALYIMGILRKYDNNAPAFAGGFAKYTIDQNGAYIFDRNAIIETQVEELFEEMISGSVKLLPEYRDRLPLVLAMEVQNRALSVKNPRFPHKLLTEHEIKHLQVEIETGLKLQQVRDKDPGFLDRLHQVIAEGHECFAGPVLNDRRNTNNAWIESRLSWILWDEEKWNFVKGDHPAFDYKFMAGDDASDVVFHKLTPETIANAYASHGPMMCFMAASFLLDRQQKGIEITAPVLNQLQNVATSLSMQP